jgi:ankyrin repeat protein
MDYTRYLFDAPQPHRGTCSWIFENSAFLRWIEDPLPSLFWLHGLPGRGKTVLARYIVETLKTNDVAFTHLQGRKLPIAHYSCLAQDQDRGSQLAVLRSILHQLLLEEPSLHGALNHTVAKYGRDHDAFSNTLGLWDALEVVLSTASLRNTFIVVDALDEMEPTNLREFLIGLTNMINHLQKDRPNQQIKIFVTSRPNIEIAVRFESHIATECEIPSADVRKDLEAFVKNTVSRFGEENAFPSRVILRIESEIILKADGMFLWASLAWAHFREGVTMWSEGVVEKRLALLKMLPKGLEPLYGEMLQNVDLVHSSELLGLFGCILTACRPLSCPEIAEALAVKEGHKSSSDLDVAFSVDVTIKRTCPNLVKIDVAGAVSFTHQSIKEFYMQHWVGSRFQAANRRFALTCLRYLNFDDIERVAEQDVRRRREECCILSERFPLFSYASQHLVDHLRAVSYDDDMWLDYSRMIQKKALFHATSLPDHSSHGAGCEIRSGKSPLKVAISTGSTSLVKRLVNHGYNINERYTINPWNYFHGSRGGTPLHDFMEEPDWADLLLELGASPNEQDMLGRTPLHLAISTKQMETINKLLSIENIDLNIRDSQGCTALHWAVTRRMVTVIHNLLKDQRVNVNIEDNDGRTPFTYAAYWGDQSIMVELLKSSKALLAHQELSGLSPVICAAQHRWKDMTVDLIRMVPDINVHRGLDRKGIIHWAIINEWDDVLVLAVEQAGAKLNHIDTSGKTPLHYAAELGIPTAARRLLRCGASVHISDNNGRTALHAAAVEGFADVLNVLLQESKFDVNEEDHQRCSLVHWAASWDWVSIMTLVLEQPDLDVVKKDGYGRTALHVAALCGCPNVLEKLLGLDDFDVTETDGFGNTLLHLAARGGSVSVTNMLLDLPALWRHRVNYWGQTALDCASIYNTLDVMEVLRKAGLRFQVAEDPLLRPRPAPTVECSDHSPISYNADGSIRAGILIRMGTEQKSSRDRLKEMRRPPVPPVTPPQGDRWTSYGEDETDWSDESNSNEYRRYSLDGSGLDPYRTRQR